MRVNTLAAIVLLVLMPATARAQSIGEGFDSGAATGNRAAGPIGGLVGGVVGGALGGAEGAVRGVVGAPRRPYYHRSPRGNRCIVRHGHRYCR